MPEYIPSAPPVHLHSNVPNYGCLMPYCISTAANSLNKLESTYKVLTPNILNLTYEGLWVTPYHEENATFTGSSPVSNRVLGEMDSNTFKESQQLHI